MNEYERGKRFVVDLETAQEQELERIRAYHGLKNYAEVLRFLIRQEARKLFESAPLFAAEVQQ